MTRLAKRGEHWLVVLVVVATTAVGMMGFAAVFPLITLWVRELGISHTQAGVLSGLWYLPGFVVALPAGWMLDRYPWRWVLLPAWVLTIAGTALMAVATNFWVLCIGRLLFSIGMNVHMVGGPKLISTWFEGRTDVGFAMGLYAMSAPIGIFASLKVLSSVGTDHGWRAALNVMTIVAVVGLLVLLLIPAAAPGSRSRTDAPPARVRPFHLGHAAWLMGIGYFGYNIGTEAYLTFTPDYLVQRGYALVAASAMVGNYAYASFVLKPVFSLFLKRANAAWFVVVASALAVVSVVLLLSGVFSPTIPSVVMGISLALGMPALYALPPLVFGPEKSGQVYGLYQLLYSFGFFAQPLVGYATDAGGGYSSGYLVIIAYCALGPLVVLASRRRSQERP